MSGLRSLHTMNLSHAFPGKPRKVLAFAYSYLRDKAEAEDVVMESMIALWEIETAGKKIVTCMPCC